MSQAKELESSFIELENKNRKNTIVGCIHQHPNMAITEFISDFLEKKSCTPWGLQHKSIEL